MTKFEPIQINQQYSITLDEIGQVTLQQTDVGCVDSMSYYYLRNDLPLFICRHAPSANLRVIHDVMVQLDTQIATMSECGCLKVGGQNVAMR